MRCSLRLERIWARGIMFMGMSIASLFMISMQIWAAEGKWDTCKEGITLWNSNPLPNESCSYTGGVNDAKKAHGTGVVVWFQDEVMSQVAIMEYDNGEIKGIFKIIERDGTIKESQQPTSTNPPESQCPYNIRETLSWLNRAYDQLLYESSSWVTNKTTADLANALIRGKEIINDDNCREDGNWRELGVRIITIENEIRQRTLDNLK